MKGGKREGEVKDMYGVVSDVEAVLGEDECAVQPTVAGAQLLHHPALAPPPTLTSAALFLLL